MQDLISHLSPEEQKTVSECLNAAADGPFFPDWEFETLFGVSRAVVKDTGLHWRNMAVPDEDAAAAIIGAMNNLLGYPHQQEDRWHEFITVTPEAVKETLDKLLSLGL